MATTNINIRIDSETKAQAQELFAQIGLDMSTAINLFLKQALRERAIPFVIRLRNDGFDTLRQSIAEREAGIPGYTVEEFSARMKEAIARGAAANEQRQQAL